MIMPKANQVVENVVVQVIEAPKAEFLLQTSDAKHLDTCVELFSDGESLKGEGEYKIKQSAVILGQVLMPDSAVKPTLAQYNTVKQVWIRKSMAFNPSRSEDATQKAWERCFSAACRENPDLSKPKSKEGSAVKMSEKRKAEAEQLQKLDNEQLNELYAHYKNSDELTKAGVVKREIKARNQSADDVVNAERKALREQIRKQLAQTMDMDLLREVSAMLPKLVMQAQ
jgi:hypothetical protein